MNSKDWFKSWFNTPYYHVLYQHRDNTEAEVFIDHLVDYLKPKSSASFLDLACGRGRHAIYLNKKGHDVVGLDLSDESIAFANDFKNDSLSFEVGDMRKPFGSLRFDYIFNLFTSFGYFNSDDENQEAVKQMSNALSDNGILVLDFMNSEKVAKGLVKDEVKVAGGITFRIKRIIREEKIIKQISFEDNGKSYNFEERVDALNLNDFKRYMKAAGLEIIKQFGGFELQKFDCEHSDRLILIARKK